MAAEIIGNHSIICVGPADPARKTFGIKKSAAANVATNVITNAGMICTKTIVFNVAMPVDFEFNPIHIPNQNRAARFPIVVTIVANVSTMESSVVEKFKSPTAALVCVLTVTKPTLLFVVTTVTLLVLVPLPVVPGIGVGAGRGAGMVAAAPVIWLNQKCCAKAPPVNCTAKSTINGAATLRNEPRQRPCTISLTLMGVPRSNSRKPLRRLSTKNRPASEAIAR